MFDFFMDCTIAMIRKRNVNILAYPEGKSVLERLEKFPTKYDDGMMQRKAEKIRDIMSDTCRGETYERTITAAFE